MSFLIRWLVKAQPSVAIQVVPTQPATVQFVNPPHSAFGILVAPLGRGR